MNTYSIGIDIGGTNTDIGLVRDDGRCLAKKNLPTNKYYDASIYVNQILDG
jgi:predicted NBD/HSP70 family sugar kinase